MNKDKYIELLEDMILMAEEYLSWEGVGPSHSLYLETETKINESRGIKLGSNNERYDYLTDKYGVF
jgi:hypothetical protein